MDANTSGDTFGPGSCASHEAPSGLRHSAAIPIAEMPRNQISVEEAKAVCERAGILVFEPETDAEKLDRLWQDFVRFASSIENLTSKGARLPPRDYLSYGVALVIRAAHSVAETAL